MREATSEGAKPIIRDCIIGYVKPKQVRCPPMRRGFGGGGRGRGWLKAAREKRHGIRTHDIVGHVAFPQIRKW